MPEDPKTPPPPAGGPSEPVSQEEILAWETAAFPDEDEFTWVYPDDEDEPWPAEGPRRSGFEQGGPADTMLPGAVLAGLAELTWLDGLGGLDDDELTGVMQAAHRLGAWAAALKLLAASGLAGRRETEARASGDWRGFEHAEDEIALALTLTRIGAAQVLALALSLGRLPLTTAALTAGAIDERRADVIADELAGLDDEQAAAVEALIIGKAAHQTTGELRPAVRRAVIAADPSSAKRRKEEALKDARVEKSSASSGTATLTGRDLPPAEVLAADKHLTALARAMKNAGADGTMDQLRAHVYLHLLTGQPAATLLTPPGDGAPGDGPSGDGAPGDGAPGDGTPGDAPWIRLPALRGTVNLTMPLAAWLGWSESPGHVPGFGTMDADDSRTIAGLLARDPTTQWCVTLTDAAGRSVAHGCAKTGPRPPGGPDAGPVPRAGPGPSPPGDPGWVRALKITRLQTGDCTHPRETRAYQPSRALRHIIQIRQDSCSHPGCRRPATGCDLDHTVPFHLGGRTCECGIAPICRRHHQAKQAPGWALAQRQPGFMTWRTPVGRTYTTEPTCYPA